MDRTLDFPRCQLHQLDLRNRLANYNYLLRCKASGAVAAIDPTEADRVLRALDDLGWELSAIWCTHHHADHVGGVEALRKATGAQVYGHSADAHRLPPLDVALHDGQYFRHGALDVQVMDVSGHTIGHIAYYLPDAGLLFSGDTVFSMGCGRLFEGTPAQMLASFDRIAALPDDTLICCAHEYTESNGRFARTLEPENTQLRARLKQVRDLRRADMPTVPMTLALEKASNPFFRTRESAIRAAAGLSDDAHDADVFATVRQKKDTFA